MILSGKLKGNIGEKSNKTPFENDFENFCVALRDEK